MNQRDRDALTPHELVSDAVYRLLGEGAIPTKVSLVITYLDIDGHKDHEVFAATDYEHDRD